MGKTNVLEAGCPAGCLRTAGARRTLYWARDSLSEMQLRDVSLLLKGAKELDHDDVREWVDKRNLEAVWKRLPICKTPPLSWNRRGSRCSPPGRRPRVAMAASMYDTSRLITDPPFGETIWNGPAASGVGRFSSATTAMSSVTPRERWPWLG